MARSVGPGVGVTVGAIPVSSLGREEPGPTDSQAESSTGDWASRTPTVPGGAAALETRLDSLSGQPPTPAVAFAPLASLAAHPDGPAAAQTPDESARKESIEELVAFGLVAAGAVIGIAGLLLPWANSTGIGIGNYGSNNTNPQANQWGLGMPASIFLFLLSGLVLGAASGSDRAKERLPALGTVIGQVTDLIMPMILGGVYLGVFLLYLTLPSGFGMGVLTMLLGGGLLIGGAIVTLFFPPEEAPEIP